MTQMQKVKCEILINIKGIVHEIGDTYTEDTKASKPKTEMTSIKT